MKLCLYLSMATASISFTMSETKLWAPLRQWLKAKSTFLGDLVSCGYCLGHWVALVLVVIYKPRLFPLWWLLDYFLVILLIAWFAGFQWVLMCLLMKVAGK